MRIPPRWLLICLLLCLLLQAGGLSLHPASERALSAGEQCSQRVYFHARGHHPGFPARPSKRRAVLLLRETEETTKPPAVPDHGFAVPSLCRPPRRSDAPRVIACFHLDTPSHPLYLVLRTLLL